MLGDGAVVEAFVNEDYSTASSYVLTGDIASGSSYYVINVDANTGDNVSFRVNGINISGENSTPQPWSVGPHPSDVAQFGYFNLTINITDDGSPCNCYSTKTCTGTYFTHAGCEGGYCVHSICRSASTYCGDGYCDTGESCSADNSACSSGYACTNGCQSSGTTTGGNGGGGGGGAATVECTEQWECTAYGPCIDGKQTRNCTDKNNCSTTENKPATERACVKREEEEEEVPEEEEEAKPPTESGSYVGQVQVHDNVNWAWTGTEWVKEGTAKYEEIVVKKPLFGKLERVWMYIFIGVIVVAIAIVIIEIKRKKIPRF